MYLSQAGTLKLDQIVFEYENKKPRDDPAVFHDLKDAGNLTPTSNLVFKQWKMDENDELFISGYIRTIYGKPLAIDIQNIIKSYYEKKFNKKEINRKIEYKLREIARKKSIDKLIANERKERYSLLITMLGLSCCILTVLIAPDIAALVINAVYDCDGVQSSKMDLNISQFLFIGSMTHLIGYIVPLLLLWIALGIAAIFDITGDHYIIWIPLMCDCCLMILGELFLFSWNVIGFVLYSDIGSVVDKQCADITIAWSVLMMIELCILPLLYGLIADNIMNRS